MISRTEGINEYLEVAPPLRKSHTNHSKDRGRGRAFTREEAPHYKTYHPQSP